MNYRQAFEAGKRTLADAGISEDELDARLLLEFVCGTDRNTLLVHPGREVSGEEWARFFELTRKRAMHTPLQQLTGEQSFMGLDFQVNQNVLIPRQDTEILVEEALKELHDGYDILDMCTGSGCILISLLRYSNDCHGVGVDLSEAALDVAKSNAERLLAEKTEEGREPAVFLQSNLFEKVEGQFDLLVSNPPYIRTDEIETLMPEVRDHEPRMALDGEADGLFFYRKIVEECPAYLKRGGTILFEIGFDQAEEVKALMEQGGFHEIRVVKDYAGNDRVVVGNLKFEI